MGSAYGVSAGAIAAEQRSLEARRSAMAQQCMQQKRALEGLTSGLDVRLAEYKERERRAAEEMAFTQMRNYTKQRYDAYCTMDGTIKVGDMVRCKNVPDGKWHVFTEGTFYMITAIQEDGFIQLSEDYEGGWWHYGTHFEIECPDWVANSVISDGTNVQSALEEIDNRNNEEASMLAEVKNDMKNFFRENKSLVYWTLGLILLDRFYFNGMFEDKIKRIVERLAGYVETKLDELAGGPKDEA